MPSNDQEPDYDIFKDSWIYEVKEDDVSNSFEDTNIATSFCENIESSNGVSKSNLISLCENFVKHYLYISDEDILATIKYDNIKCFKLLNYWLNDKLRKMDTTDEIRQKFCRHINNNKKNFDLEENFKNNIIYAIDKEDFDKMQLLYRLYDNYYKIFGKNINDTEKKNCSIYVSACYNDYKEGLQKCSNENTRDIKLCDALKNFRDLYEENKLKKTLCNDSHLKELLDLESLHLINEKNITRSEEIISPVNVHIYASHICDAFFKKLNSEYYYDIFDGYDYENKKLELFKVINDFYKCYLSIKNTNPAEAISHRAYFRLFVYEYVDLYHEIKSECSSNGDIKSYCSHYKTYKRLYEKEDNSYFERGKRPEVKKKLFNQQSIQLEKPISTSGYIYDDASNTAITHPIISICAFLGTFFILFILYKFTPLGSYFRISIRKKKRWKGVKIKTNRSSSPPSEYELINFNRNAYGILYHS
ncbi:variable surface protein [Plasmodium gonderi]|uniref:Variable surface protein n=1 Tax=Plasmodium gonderi TaxID=77519 RepID=A0A1Y1JAS7_PLAGO|nr:variable surface protein [Plasmodium gonderi]GAW79596.1 variable surface protein [Plasmodium gonderi]